MLLITVAAVVAPPVSQRAFGVGSPDAWKAIVERLQASDGPTATSFILGMIQQGAMADLGAPLFTAGTATPIDATQLSQIKPGFVKFFPNAKTVDVALWAPSSDSESQTHAQRATAIATVVDPSAAFKTIQMMSNSKADPASVTVNNLTSPAITFLIARAA
jgi:hypothetical protein